MMKKLFLSVLCLTLLVSATFFVSGCKKKHTHSFTEQAVKDEYLSTAADCTNKAKYFYSCSCGEKGTETFEYGSPLGHSLSEWKIQKEATETEKGLKTRNCTRNGCNYSETENIPMLSHTHKFTAEIAAEKYLATAATCTEKAKYYYSCSCGEKGTETFEYGSPLGHSLSEWKIQKEATETEKGLKTRNCTRSGCNYSETENIPMLSHTHKFNLETATDKYLATAATCTEKAKYYYSCSCGEKGTQTFTYGAALGHSFTNYVSNNNATCTKDGTKTAKCDRCNETDTVIDIDSKLGHEFTNYVSDNNATYEKDGTKTAHCNRDGCTATNTIPDEGSKLESKISFKTLTVGQKNIDGNMPVYGKVSNSQKNYSFIDEVETWGNIQYVVSLDIYGIQQVATKTIPLKEGDNVVYITEQLNGNPKAVYEVTIRRREIYTVTFNSQGGTTVENQAIEEDSFAIQPASPTKKGYTFNKWAFDFSAPITKNTEINAEWTANIDTKYKVEYYFENIENTNYTLYETDNLQGITDTTANAGIKKFEHFTYIENKGNLSGNISANEDLVLKLYYSRNIYTVAFDLGKGEIKYNSYLLTQTIKYNGNAKDISNIVSLKGASFNSWDKSLDNIDKDTTIKAIWDYITYHITFKDPTFNNVVESIDYTVEQTPLKLPELKNYVKVLKGWRWEKEGSYITYIYNEITKDNLGDYNFTSSWDDIIKVINYNKPSSYSGYTHWILTDTAKEKCAELNVIELNKLIAKSSYRDLPLKLNGCQKLETLVIPPNKRIEEYFKDWEYDNSYKIDYVYNKNFSNEIKYSSYYPNSLKTLRVMGNEENSSVISGIISRCNIEYLYVEGVTSIGEWAFSDCKGLTSVMIGNGVISIGKYAFYGCSRLTSITISDSVTSIGDYAFMECSGLTSIMIPNGVTSIGDYAFWYCSRLTSVMIGNCVVSIGSGAFSGCSGLASITIPDSVTTIGGSAFSGCSGLTSVTIGNGVTTIGGSAFYRCSALTSITIPDSVTSIGSYAFSDCSGLTIITIPDSVISIGDSAFKNCSELTSVIWNAKNCAEAGSYNNPIFSGCSNLATVIIDENVEIIPSDTFRGCSRLTSITIPGSVTSIGNSAFGGCSGLTIITIHNSVTSIGNSAFSGCSSLTSVTIGNGVTSIGNDAFYNCSGIESFVVTIGNKKYHSANNCIIETETKKLIAGCKTSIIPSDGSVTSIGDRAFSGCSGLTIITIPDSVTSIGNSAFSGCSSLTSVTIPDSVTSIGSWTFYNCSGLASVTIGNSVNSIASAAFYNCSGLTSVTIGNGVTSIGNSAFKYCSGLTSITIPNSVTSIGNETFYNCRGLTSVIIGNGVTSIDYQAFYNCRGLISVSIPDSVTSIGGEAFYNCSGLTSVIIGNGVTSIGYQAFYDCGNLASVTIPDSVTSIDSEAFSGTTWYNNQPDGLVYAGKTAYKYKGAMPDNTTIVIKEGTVSIIDYSFKNCSGLASVIIPDSVTSIGNEAFFNCSGLTSVTIGNGVISIGNSAFKYCSGLTSVTIPNSVTSIGSNAFYDCSNLTSVNYLGVIDQWAEIYFYNNIANPLCYAKKLYTNNDLVTEVNLTTATKISSYAFYNCSGLTSVTIGNGVTTIGSSAFRGCSGLTSITIPDSVTTIDSYAFESCRGLTSITIPDSVTTIGSSAFYNCSGLISITIPNSVTSIGSNAFYDCSNLTSVNYLGAIDQWVEINFSDNCANPLSYAKKLYINNDLVTEVNLTAATKISSYAFYNCSGLTSVTIGNGVTTIGSSAFRGCSGLTSITIPDSVTTIDSYAFESCRGLTSVTIGNSVTSIGSYAFYNCSGLTSITIPNSVTSIGSNAFSGCSSLTSVTIPDSVTSIENYAFVQCGKLKEIHFEGTMKQWKAIGKGSNWNSYMGSYTIYCTDGTISK